MKNHLSTSRITLLVFLLGFGFSQLMAQFGPPPAGVKNAVSKNLKAIRTADAQGFKSSLDKISYPSIIDDTLIFLKANIITSYSKIEFKPEGNGGLVLIHLSRTANTRLYYDLMKQPRYRNMVRGKVDNPNKVMMFRVRKKGNTYVIAT